MINFYPHNLVVSLLKLQYCAIETCGENEIPFYFHSISPTCFTQIPHMGSFVKQFSLILPLFPDVGEIDFPVREFCFPIGETQFPNFPPISPEFPPNSPDFPMIPTDSPDSPVYCAIFNITSQVYIVSEH